MEPGEGLIRTARFGRQLDNPGERELVVCLGQSCQLVDCFVLLAECLRQLDEVGVSVLVSGLDCALIPVQGLLGLLGAFHQVAGEPGGVFAACGVG
ncbi:hypothetical protein ABZ726_28935, partial [Streptomyces hundungensis]|uniref:hypothetical protein n=1 Tax=Streptomyces hundungensis TaxID=1077946 RepID=UPI0033DBF050